TGAAVDNRDDRWSAGTITVGTHRIVVPPRLLIELPGAALTLQELFVLAPERCRKDGATGLLASDACRVGRDGSQTKPPWSPRDDTTPRSTLEPEPNGAPPATIAHVTAVGGEGSDSIATKIVLTRDRPLGVWRGHVRERRTGLPADQRRIWRRPGRRAGPHQRPDARQSAQSGVACGSEGN